MMRIIGGEFGGRRIQSISGPGYRPATGKVRQAVFSMLESRGVIWPDTRVIDCFAGSGSLGLEALSRGARQVWFVEKNRHAARSIEQNCRTLEIHPDRFRVLARDVFSVLKQKNGPLFALAFVDPPYGRAYALPALNRIGSLLDSGGYVVSEVESALDFQAALFQDLDLLLNRTYGQTRIGLWIANVRR